MKYSLPKTLNLSAKELKDSIQMDTVFMFYIATDARKGNLLINATNNIEKEVHIVRLH